MVPKLVIFDMDGLVFDTERLFMDQKAIVMKKYGFLQKEEDYAQTLGLSGDALNAKLAELYGNDYPADTISAETREALDHYIEENGLEPKSGICELLKWLHTKETVCAIASSTPRAYIEKYLHLSGLEQDFSFIIGGDETTCSKPDPELFERVCEHFNIDPFHTVVLEDSENGLLAAWSARIPVICIPDLTYPSPDLIRRTIGVVKNAEEVIQILEKI